MGVEHLREVKAHGFRDRRERDDVEGELQPAGGLHRRWLKFFRMNHRDEQIGEQREGNQTDDKVFHKFPYSFSHQRAYKPPATKKSAMTAMKIKSIIGFVFKLRTRRAKASRPLNQIVLIHVRTMTQR